MYSFDTVCLYVVEWWGMEEQGVATLDFLCYIIRLV